MSAKMNKWMNETFSKTWLEENDQGTENLESNLRNIYKILTGLKKYINAK